MPQPASIKTVAPMLNTIDMESSLAFYKDILGFTPVVSSPSYCVIERDGQLIHLQQVEDTPAMKTVRDHTEIYIEVRNIRQLWEHVRNFKDRFKVRDLFAREYGMTEFHIIEPNTCLVFVGEVTSEMSS